jgi:phage shock protein PspC (stress-responsive transcriptional regulator)
MSIAEDLEKLQALRERGAINDDEFQRAKARILDQPPALGSGGGGAHGSFLHQLARSRDDRWLGGVCGGLGRHTGLPSWGWRIIFCAAALYFGVGCVLYLLMWIFMPAESGTP